jgi:hypothetical protein
MSGPSTILDAPAEFSILMTDAAPGAYSAVVHPDRRLGRF